MNAIDTLIKKYDIFGATSDAAICTAINNAFDMQEDGVLNKLNADLELIGVPAQSHRVDADVMLKHIMIVAARGLLVSLSDEIAAAEVRMKKLRSRLPYLYVDELQLDGVKVPSEKKVRGVIEKKVAQAGCPFKRQYDAGMRIKGDIVRAVAEEMGTDYSAAYYFCAKRIKELKITDLDSTKTKKKKAS